MFLDDEGACCDVSNCQQVAVDNNHLDVGYCLRQYNLDCALERPSPGCDIPM
jgi:hypothetical protein